MKVISKENAEHYHWGPKESEKPCDGWHLVKSQSLSVIQECVPAGCEEVRHLHRRAEQFFFVLSGLATIEANGKLFKLSPMQGLHIPANIPHQLKNQSDEDLIFTVTSTPPSHGDRIEVPEG